MVPVGKGPNPHALISHLRGKVSCAMKVPWVVELLIFSYVAATHEACRLTPGYCFVGFCKLHMPGEQSWNGITRDWKKDCLNMQVAGSEAVRTIPVSGHIRRLVLLCMRKDRGVQSFHIFSGLRLKKQAETTT